MHSCCPLALRGPLITPLLPLCSADLSRASTTLVPSGSPPAASDASAASAAARACAAEACAMADRCRMVLAICSGVVSLNLSRAFSAKLGSDDTVRWIWSGSMPIARSCAFSASLMF